MGPWIELVFLILCATAMERHGVRRGLIRAVASVVAATGLFLGTLPPALAEQVQNRGATLAGGFSHFCAVMSDGTVQCWGENRFGQLGNGTTARSSAVTVSGVTNAVAVASGFDHSCAVLADGRVQCWGSNAGGRLGNGSTSKSSVPVPVTVSGLTNAVALTAGSGHTCALLADGRVQCWGTGPLGNGTISRSSVPVPVSGVTNAVAVAGGGGHTCAVLADGRVQCWGGQSLVPVTVSGITNAIGVASGTQTCAVLADGRVQCWGGQSLVPVTVSGITNAVAVAASTCDYSCALLADGRVQCWGHKLHFGTPGDKITETFLSSASKSSLVPVTIGGITKAVALAAADLYPCVVLADGRVQCWGWGALNPSLLGDGTTSKSSNPVTVSGLANAVAVR